MKYSQLANLRTTVQDEFRGNDRNANSENDENDQYYVVNALAAGIGTLDVVVVVEVVVAFAGGFLVVDFACGQSRMFCTHSHYCASLRGRSPAASKSQRSNT